MMPSRKSKEVRRTMIIRPDRWKVVGTIVLLTLVVVCGSTPRVTAATGDEQTAVRVAVSILPQVWFAERIGGERVQVSVLVGPGQSPATYDASARQMARPIPRDPPVTRATFCSIMRMGLLVSAPFGRGVL